MIGIAKKNNKGNEVTKKDEELFVNLRTYVNLVVNSALQ